MLLRNFLDCFAGDFPVIFSDPFLVVFERTCLSDDPLSLVLRAEIATLQLDRAGLVSRFLFQ